MPDDVEVSSATNANAKERLKSFVERVERLEEEIRTLNDDKSETYKEAKGEGWDVKALKTIIRMRKQDPLDRAEQETVLETYMQALGMI